MIKSLKWRFVLIAVVVAAWTYSLFPLTEKDFATEFEKIRLETKSDASKEDLAKAPKAELDKILAEAKKMSEADRKKTYANAIVQVADDKRFVLANYITVPGVGTNASNKEVIEYVSKKCKGKLNLGLDLKGGTEFIIKVQGLGDGGNLRNDKSPEGVAKLAAFEKAKKALDKALETRSMDNLLQDVLQVLRNRIDNLGVKEPEIKVVGDAISIRMPVLREDDKEDIRKLIQQNARLEFRLVHKDSSRMAAEYKSSPKAAAALKSRLDNEGGEYEVLTMKEMRKGKLVEDVVVVSSTPEKVRGDQLVTASARPNALGRWQVSLKFDSKGTRNFAKVTTDNVNRRLAIVLDGELKSAPNLNEPITGGSAVISGSFSPEEANNLAIVLRCGNLPVSIDIDSEMGTDPTLGAESVKSGTMAAYLGMILVVLFMIGYYRKAGVIAVSALTVNILLIMGSMTILGATITLPGIAGIVLTIGMAVDANVIIFERIREELQKGKSLANAIHFGYDRAFLTIFDANITTLLTAFILYKVGTGPIKGFAVTLSCGIIASMFTALFMTRAMFDALLKAGKMKKLTMVQFFKKQSIDFLGKTKITGYTSIALVFFSVVFILVKGSDALSVDFNGGTAITYTYKTLDVSGEAVQKALEAKDAMYAKAKVSFKSSAVSESKFIEVVVPKGDKGNVDVASVHSTLSSIYPDAGIAANGETRQIGSLVGEQFSEAAIWAMILAILGIVIYISFRFEFKFAVAANAALIHDVIIASGVFILMGRQLSLPVVAALLTVIGYSLNDTIVVFDRIREDLDLIKGKTYAEIINLSVNQTLSRTILTSVTTLLVVITLLVAGGPGLNDFALILCLGVIVGTYSSIFVASAIVAKWHKGVNEADEEEAKPVTVITDEK